VSGDLLDHDPAGTAAEALGRRALGLDAAWCALAGAAALAAGGPVGRHVGLPAGAVRLAGAGALGWAAALAVWSLAERWQPGVRRAAGANVLGAAALVGHAVARGTPRGRAGVLLAALQVAAFAGAQTKALMAAAPRPDAAES
jgi:hypothetical protein